MNKFLFLFDSFVTKLELTWPMTKDYSNDVTLEGNLVILEK